MACETRLVIAMKAERFVGDGPPDVPKRRDGVPTDRILDFVHRAARPLAAAGSHLPQGSSLPSGGLLLLLVRVGTKPCRRALLAARQVPAQPFRSLDSATGGAPSWPKRSRQENDTKGRRLEFAPAITCTVRVAAKHLRRTLFAQTQAAAQPLRSLAPPPAALPCGPPLIPSRATLCYCLSG